MNRLGHHHDWFVWRSGRMTHTILLILVCHAASMTSTTVEAAKIPLLEEVIAGDIFPPSSALCKSTESTATTTTTTTTTTTSSSSFSFEFTPSEESHWSYVNKNNENLVFEVVMQQNYSTTSTNDTFRNSTTKLRIGKGGNIYSLISSLFGEAIPPQSIREAPWMDEVHQMVSVNTVLNNQSPDPHPYFIHQAGTYMRDKAYTPPPFYSPTLAVHCSSTNDANDNNNISSCVVVSWGQQAHIPTPFSSPALYYTKYQDCGSGVIEVTQVIHNMIGDYKDGITPSSTLSLNYLNVPWTGIKTSNLPEMFLSNSQGKLVRQFPIQTFGREEDFPNLRNTGGYTTFSQELDTIPAELPVPVPCTDEKHTHVMDCTIKKPSKAIPIAPFQLPYNDTCRFVAGLSRTHAVYMVRLTLDTWEDIDFIPGCGRKCGGRPSLSQRGLLFTNKRTNFTIQVKDILHWRYHHKYMFFSSNVTAVVLNQEFRAGDIITISFEEKGADNDAISSSFPKIGALTFVHGKDEDYNNPENTYFYASTRMRYGLVPGPRRDMTVYTINVRATIRPGETYVNRQFILTGTLDVMEQKASKYVDETFQEMWTDKDSSAVAAVERKIGIYTNSKEDDNEKNSTKFGVVIMDHNSSQSDPCLQDKSFICSGFTTPQSGHRPLFYTTCLNTTITYAGMNPYALAPTPKMPSKMTSNKSLPLRSYACEGQSSNVRPQWKLLGYFQRGSCESIETFTFDPDFCKTKEIVQEEKVDSRL